ASQMPKDKNICLVSLKTQKESDVLILADGRKTLTVVIDEKEKISRRKLIIVGRKIISLAKNNKIKRLSINFRDFGFPRLKMSDFEIAELLGTNFEMANFEFVKYKTPPKEGWNFIEEIIVVDSISSEIKNGFKTGQIIGNEVNNCRILANTPGGEMTPKILAEHARKDALAAGIKVKILGKNEIKKLKMGGVLGVSQGSDEEPKFIILEYNKGSKNEKPIILIGKGITFDSGGLNLKTSDALSNMHLDMSGASAVIHALTLASKLKIKKNIIGLIPALENMPSGSSYRPGDILKTMSGKTIEVLNTDAEGRIILADALTYAKKYNPRLVIDIATLTGAAMVALGQRASAIFTKDEKLEKLTRELAEKAGDYVWPLPLWEEYEEEIKGTFADIANIGKTKYGGAIAPTMTAIESEYLSKGATGVPIRLLIKILENI
ncbi:MAG: putative cytosol aminopeptidase, partial [Parcubacteria group bacterium Athens1014_10]